MNPQEAFDSIVERVNAAVGSDMADASPSLVWWTVGDRTAKLANVNNILLYYCGASAEALEVVPGGSAPTEKNVADAAEAIIAYLRGNAPGP